MWLTIVSLGFVLTLFMAFLSCQDWSDDHCNDDDDGGGDRSDEPTSTSVLQIPIEHIIFPAVTICPLGESGRREKDFLLHVCTI